MWCAGHRFGLQGINLMSVCHECGLCLRNWDGETACGKACSWCSGPAVAREKEPWEYMEPRRYVCARHRHYLESRELEELSQ